MKNFSRKLSLQWRLTLITALLVTITCILMYFFISQSAVTGMDHLQNYIVQINKTDSSPITFNIDPTILFPDLSEQRPNSFFRSEALSLQYSSFC